MPNSRLTPRRMALTFFGLLVAVSAGLMPAGGGEKAKTPEILATLKGHTDAVYAVAFSKDGKYLVTGSFDHTLKLWETATGKELKTFGGPAGHQKMVLTVAFSPDGQSIASGGVDNTLKIWDVPSGSPLRALTNNDAINGLALSPDGTKLATAGKDGVIKVWSAADFKQPLLTLTGHTGPVTSVTFSANNQMLASTGADKAVRFWNAASGQLIAAVGAHTAAANAVIFNPNNAAAYSVGDDGMLKWWQVPPVAPRLLPAHAAAVTSLFLSADGNTLLSGGGDKTVRLVQLATGKEVRVFTGASGSIGGLGLSPKGDVVAAGTSDSRLFVWNANDAKPISQIIAHQGAVSGVSFHPANPQVLTGGGDGLLKLWALPAPARLLPHPDAVLAATISADGKRLFTGSADKILRSWDTAKNAIDRQFAGHAGPVTAVAASANGQLLASGSADATIRLWNQATGKESDILGAHGGTVTSLAVNAAGNQIVSSSEDGTLKAWQLPIVAAKPFVHPDQATCLAVSPDGTKLLTGCGDKVVRLWNIASGAKERDFTGPTQPVQAVAFSGNGALVAAGSADKSLSVWSAGDAKLLKKIDNLPAAVHAVALNPDGKFIAAGLADASVRIYDLPAGKEIKNIAGHKAAVNALLYLLKGDQLLAASADKTVQLWNVGDGTSKAKFEHAGPVTTLALRKDGAAFIAGADKTAKAWNLGDGKETLSIATPSEVKGVGFSPDTSRIVIAGADNRVRLYGGDGKLQEFFVHDAPAVAAAFIDAKRVVSASADKTARVWTSALLWQKSHAGPVRQVLYKGDQILGAGDDKTIKIWNAADGKELKSIAAHEGPVTRLALSGDGARLVSAGADKAVKVWNLAQPKDEKPIAVFSLGTMPESLALSGNGQRIAVATDDKTSHPIRIFDVALGREVFVVPDHAGAVHGLAFLGDNRTVLSASADKTVRLSDVPLLTLFEAHKGGVLDVLFSVNGAQALSAGADNTVKLWDMTKNVMVKTFGPLPEPIKALAWSRDNALVGAASGKVVKLWNIGDGKELATITNLADVRSLSISPDKTKLAVGAADNLTRVFDLPGGNALQFFPQDEPVTAVVFDTKNTGIISAGGKTPRAETLSIARLIPAANGPIHALTLTPTNTHVLTGGADKQVKFWNLANGANDRSLPPAPDAIRVIAMSKNNVLIAVATADQIVRLYNAADGKELGNVKAGGQVRSLAFAPNNLALAAGCADKALLTWSVGFTPGQPLPQDFLKPIQSFAHDDAITDVAFAADSATLFSSGLDKSVRAWKLASPVPTKNFPHPNLVDAVAFHPTQPQIASGGHDGKVRFFDLVKGAQIREITAHIAKDPKQPKDPFIYTVVFSPDGKYLVSGGADHSLKLWDTASGNLVREFKPFTVKDFEQGHQDPVFAATFSPDGKLLASGSAGLERVIKIWNVDDGKVLRDLVNPNIKSADPKHPQSHPGWIYNLRFTTDGKLVSIGDAPKNSGYLAVWNPQDGKLLYAETMPLGTFYGLAIAPDNQTLAIGVGPRGRPTPDFNSAYLLRMPVK